MNYNNKFFKYTSSIVLVLVGIFLLGQIDFILAPLGTVLKILIFPFVGAALFYYLLRPLIRFLEKKKINKTAAVIGVFVAIIGLGFIFTIFAGGSVKEEFNDFYVTFSDQLQVAQKTTEDILNEGNWWKFSGEELEERAISSLELIFGQLAENITDWISAVLNIGTIIILVPIVAFFLLKDDELFHKNMIKLIPPKHKDTATVLFKDIDSTLSIYITGQLIVAAFLGILTYIGYLIIGLPTAIILAIFTMVTSIIPFIGPVLGVLPALFIAVTVDYFMVIKVLIVLLVTQQLEGNLVRPSVMGNRLQIHPLTIILLIIIAVSLYGFVGAFLAIPLYAVVRVILRHFFGEYFSSE